MAVKIIDGDLFSASSRYICHQVNCRGRMGSGIAKVIRDKFPEAFEKYKEECKKGACLGHVQYVLSNGKLSSICLRRMDTGTTAPGTQIMMRS